MNQGRVFGLAKERVRHGGAAAVGNANSARPKSLAKTTDLIFVFKVVLVEFGQFRFYWCSFEVFIGHILPILFFKF